jgi:hypothetical protein
MFVPRPELADLAIVSDVDHLPNLFPRKLRTNASLLHGHPGMPLRSYSDTLPPAASASLVFAILGEGVVEMLDARFGVVGCISTVSSPPWTWHPSPLNAKRRDWKLAHCRNTRFYLRLYST